MSAPAIPARFAGADWLEASLGVKCSAIGRTVADMLGDLYYGIYHIPTKALQKVDWSNERHIEIVLQQSRSLATYDFDDLTRLVFLAHDARVRVQIEACAPWRLRIYFHPRELREGGRLYERHPTIERALAAWREHHPAEDIAP